MLLISYSYITFRSFQISPLCEDVLVRCQWGDTVVNCSEIFTKRKTWEGHCCMFNYERPYDMLSAQKYVRYHKYRFAHTLCDMKRNGRYGRCPTIITNYDNTVNPLMAGCGFFCTHQTGEG